MSLDGMHILIVDDDQYVLDTLSELLKLENAKVTTANNGNMAFDLITNPNDFDLILSDIRMSGCTGLELLKKLKAYKDKVPDVILVSAFADITPKRAKSMSAAAIFAKKDVMERLVEHVKEKKIKDQNPDNEISDIELDHNNILNFTVR